jgi:prephenate dehydrogenase
MGSSLGLAAKAQDIRVSGWARRRATREEALSAGVLDSIHDTPDSAVSDADMVIICTPILTITELVEKIYPSIKAGCIITDVGSTKQYVTDQIEPLLKNSGIEFIGSHPMTGSEQSGLSSASAGLYKDAPVIITPTNAVSPAAKNALTEFWQRLGAKVLELTPAAHDQMIARTSHLPHITAAILTETTTRGNTPIAPFCGPGIRDTTRVAAGSEDVWHDIIKTNHSAIQAELAAFAKDLDNFRQLLEQGDFESIRQHLAYCRRKRQQDI